MTPDELDSLWDFDDPDGSERRFRALCPGRERSRAAALLAELLTQLARAEGLQRRFDDADRTLDEAQRRRSCRATRAAASGSCSSAAACDRPERGPRKLAFLDAWDGRERPATTHSPSTRRTCSASSSRGGGVGVERAGDGARPRVAGPGRPPLGRLAREQHGLGATDAGAYDEALELFRLALDEWRA